MPTTKQRTIECRFHPQKWENDYAIELPVHPHPPVWSVPLAWARENKAIGDDDSYETDRLRDYESAPEWIQNWSGPFYVEILNREEVAYDDAQ